MKAEIVVVERARTEIVEVARQGPPGPPGKVDAAAVADAVTGWLDANGVTGAVRYDAAQSLTTAEIEQAQENLDLNTTDFALIYQTAKL